MKMVIMTADEVYVRRKRIDTLFRELGDRIDWKQIVVGCSLMCISLSVVAVVLVQSAIANTPPRGSGLVVVFVAFVGSLAGFMIMHRGTERAWL
jgi:hypothetical protein